MLIVYVNHTIPPGTLFTVGEDQVVDRGMIFEPLSVVTATREFAMDVDSSMSFVNGSTFVSHVVDVELDKAHFTFNEGKVTILAPNGNTLAKPEFTFRAEREAIRNRVVQLPKATFNFYTGKTGLEVSFNNELAPSTFTFDTDRVTIHSNARTVQNPEFHYTDRDVVTNPTNTNFKQRTFVTDEDFSHTTGNITMKLVTESDAVNITDALILNGGAITVNLTTGK